MQSFIASFSFFPKRRWRSKEEKKRQDFSKSLWQSYLKGIVFVFFFLILIVSFVLGKDIFSSNWMLFRLKEQNLHWLAPPRGLIFDTRGKLLVENRPIYYLNGRWLSYPEMFWSSFLGVEATQSSFLTNKKLPTRYLRYYPFDSVTAPVLGYVNLVSKKELDLHYCSPEQRRYCLTANSFVGQGGIEKSYELYLQGKPGVAVKDNIWYPPRAGKDLQLTLDLQLQEYIFDLLKEEGKVGAVVVLDRSGGVLSLVSYPSFSANALSGSYPQDKKKREKIVKDIFQDETKPLINKAYQEAYPPGSVFKLVTALAALDQGRIDLKTEIEDTGFIKVKNYIYRNWYWTEYGRKEGKLNVIRALARSNDIFFYKVGALVGPEAIADYAAKLGLGQSSGVDLPDEVFGLVPTPHWKKIVRGERWFLGNTYHLAIGQGDLKVTPLQVARMTLIFALKGKKVKLHLNKAVKPSSETLEISDKSWSTVIEGMKEACLPGGTAFVFFHYPVKVAGKTGTAEEGKGKEADAWFTLFAPADKPRYVITVFLKNAGEGSYQAAPIAKEILNYLLRLKDND